MVRHIGLGLAHRIMLVQPLEGNAQLVREHAASRGMASLRDDGMRWAEQGVISLEEVVRVTRE